MANLILDTKLYVPPPPATVVPRPRLLERLNEGLQRKLTLISAPAGFGKTTLVSSWIAACDQPVAWLSLDEGDSDPARFMAYLVTALRTVAPQIGAGVLAEIESQQLPPTEAVLIALLNDISTIQGKCLLVLDDYHVVDAAAVDSALTFLLAHNAPQLHLIIITREDPQLPLARLRARGQLTELRAGDLRFTPGEAAGFLNQAMALGLADEDVSALEKRTEGWIAGLQLAAISMRGRADIPGFIRTFAGDNRYIVDYLVAEVLQCQPAAVRSFLLHTAILERFNSPLCDAVTGQVGGKARLEELERGNFFLVPLDDGRHWYRYHHLFAEVLFAYLLAEQPNLVATLHRRASAWYAQNGSVPDAIRHALAAADFEHAADLIELALPTLRRSRQEATVLGWLKALPGEIFHTRPVLSAVYAHVLLSIGELDAVEARLQDAERWLDTRKHQEAPMTAMVVADEEAFRALPGEIAVVRAGQAMALGDVVSTMKYAQQVLDLVPEDDHISRGSAAGFLGLAYWTNGDLALAHRTFAAGMASLQRGGHIAGAVGGAITLADIRIVQGRLNDAMRTYEQALQLAAAQGSPALSGTADLYVGMSELYRERGDLHAATQHLLNSQELGEQNGSAQNRYRWRVAMARIRQAQGDPDGALDLLSEAERLYVVDFSPNVRPIMAMKVRLWVAQGSLSDALTWGREQDLSAEDALSYLREFEHITLARLLLARYKHDGADRLMLEATGLLGRLLTAAEAGERTGSSIEILVLQAIAWQTQGDNAAALLPLERALTLAEPEGYVRIFIDEGAPIAVLLQEAARHGIAPGYVRQLLSALGRAQESTPSQQGLREPLSVRELDVLRLLRTEMSGPEIAHALMVSLHTIRTHTNNIYSKLGMNNRRAAVRRAEELDLL